MNPASLKISLDCEIPVSAQGLRHSDLLGKAAALINCIHPERSHCLTVNVPSIVNSPVCTSGTPFIFCLPETNSNQIITSAVQFPGSNLSTTRLLHSVTV